MNYQMLCNMKKKHFCDLLSVKFIILILCLTVSVCILFLFAAKDTTITELNFTNFEPPSTNSTLLNKLETSLSQKNLFFIGDVHGAFEELLELIDKLNYDPLKDHLIFVGDLVAKGPKSIEVVRLIRSLGASCVRGNHDDRVLRWKGLLNSVESQKIALDEYIKQNNISNVSKEEIENTEFLYNITETFAEKNEHGLLAKKLDSELYTYLLSCPIILSIPEHDLYVVHAGLLPNIPLSEQDPWNIMNMRNIKDNGRPTKSKKEGHAWSKYWNEAQKKSSSPKTIIYGHDASRGLKIKPYSFGLDSGCVFGKELSALIWNNREIISVKCKQYID